MPWEGVTLSEPSPDRLCDWARIEASVGECPGASARNRWVAVLHTWNRVNVDVEHLIQVQLALECIRVNAGGFLERVPCANPDDIGVLQVYRSGNEYYVYFRADVGADVVERICSLSPKTIFHSRPRIRRMLAEAFPGIVARAFRTYLFPHDLSREQAKDVVVVERDERQIFAIVRDGRMVSSCWSVRENAQAGECYVFTEPEYRRRGYGRQTVVAWAHSLQAMGKLPFYSHEENNTASWAVAKALKLIPCFEVASFNQE